MQTDPVLRILAAGSLGAALTEFVAEADLRGGVEPVFGPAGLLRERIAAGEACDLFLSANLEHPLALASLAAGAAVVPFATNSLVAITRRELGATTDTLLPLLLDPRVRIGTSTPGADPSGDYASLLFARAERLAAGAEARLAAKARHLVGGREPPDVPAGEDPIAWFLASGAVDVFLAYATKARSLTGFDIVQPPPGLAVVAEYGLVVLASDPRRRRRACDVVRRLLSAPGQAVLRRHGFLAAGGA